MNAPKLPLTVIIPALNEEANLPDALSSVAFADQVIVVDSHSADATARIAAAAGAEVVQFAYSGRGPKKKAWALANAPIRNDWLLLLDADERVTPPLRAEIERAVASNAHDGYCIDREFIFMGRSLRCFRPNWNLRLFRRNGAHLEDLRLGDLPGTGDNEIHEHFVLDGRPGYLRSPLLHDDDRGLSAWLDRPSETSRSASDRSRSCDSIRFAASVSSDASGCACPPGRCSGS
jgi:glycosyltransferase involved in cell wall biosynthesis